MKASWGEPIYWLATIVAGLIAAFVAWDYVYNIAEGDPFIPIFPLLCAGAIWLAGGGLAAMGSLNAETCDARNSFNANRY